MPESFEFTFDLPVYPERVYHAWLDSAEHSRFSGKAARIEARPGGQFNGLNGQVSGKIKALTPYDRIVQTWQTGDFGDEMQESTIELSFEPTCTGTEVTLRQTGIPAGKTRQVMAWWNKPTCGLYESILTRWWASIPPIWATANPG